MSEQSKGASSAAEGVAGNNNILAATVSSSIQDFEILKKLGQGAHGVVYKVRRKKDQNTYVLKQIATGNMQHKQRRECVNEAILLNQLNSPYIVRYYDSFLENNQLNIVMEYCEQGDLENFIKNQMGRPLVEKKIWKFFFQIAEGLLELHSRNILHRDIKSLNIFLTGNEQIRIGDLGVAKQLQDNKSHAHSQVGTPYYMSPEIIQDIPYNEKSDVWSLGCVLYQLATFKRPFDAANQGSLMIKIQKAQYTPISANYSQQLHKLLEKCLTKDHSKRPSIRQILSESEIQMKAKQVGHEIKLAEISSSDQNSQDESKKSIDSPAKLILKSKDFVMFQSTQVSLDKKNESMNSSDNSPHANVGQSMNSSPSERSKFRNFRLQVIGSQQSSGSISEKNTPLLQKDEKSGKIIKNQTKIENNIPEISMPIKSPTPVSRINKMPTTYGGNASQNSVPSQNERFVQDLQREYQLKHITKSTFSSNFRPFSPQIKQEGNKCLSPQLHHMKSTKSQMAFNHLSIGVGTSNFSNANLRQQISSQKDTELNFQKMIQQQSLLNKLQQQRNQTYYKQKQTNDQDDNNALFDEQLPQIIKTNSSIINTQQKEESNGIKRYDSCGKIVSRKLISKTVIQNKDDILQSRLGKSNQPSLTLIPTQASLKGNSKSIIQVKSQKQSHSLNPMQRVQSEYQFQQPQPIISSIQSKSQTNNTKRSATNLSQTDLDQAFNQIEEQIELPKYTHNQHLTKLYKQKFDLQIQNQQHSKACISALGVQLYKNVLAKFKYHINRDEELSKYEQDQINQIIDTDLKYKKDCVNKLYSLISIENQLQEIQQQIYCIELQDG